VRIVHRSPPSNSSTTLGRPSRTLTAAPLCMRATPSFRRAPWRPSNGSLGRRAWTPTNSAAFATLALLRTPPATPPPSPRQPPCSWRRPSRRTAASALVVISQPSWTSPTRVASPRQLRLLCRCDCALFGTMCWITWTTPKTTPGGCSISNRGWCGLRRRKRLLRTMIDSEVARGWLHLVHLNCPCCMYFAYVMFCCIIIIMVVVVGFVECHDSLIQRYLCVG